MTEIRVFRDRKSRAVILEPRWQEPHGGEKVEEMKEEVFRRRPGLVWRDEEEARREVLAALEEGRDVDDEGTLIIVDSGQIFELNLLGADIWKLCDGRRTVGQIVEDLLDRYDVTRDELDRDVRDFFSQMQERGWVERA